MTKTFANLGLSAPIVKALAEKGYDESTLMMASAATGLTLTQKQEGQAFSVSCTSGKRQIKNVDALMTVPRTRPIPALIPEPSSRQIERNGQLE